MALLFLLMVVALLLVLVAAPKVLQAQEAPVPVRSEEPALRARRRR